MSEVENAAAMVIRAMRALDAHRHENAPTLEREYRAALETYFLAAEQAWGRGRAELEPDEGVEDANLFEETRAWELRNERGSIAGHYAAARRALRLARSYRLEPGSSGRREQECLVTALRHREAIRAIRLRMQPAAEQLLLPGLAKTRPSADEPSVVRSA